MTETHTDETETAQDSDEFTMVVTLKGGAQIRTQVTAYTVGRDGANGLARLRWTGAAGADASLQFLDLNEVAAVHSEGLST